MIFDFFVQLQAYFDGNWKTERGFPPHVSQGTGTPAFLKITFQLHRNPTQVNSPHVASYSQQLVEQNIQFVQHVIRGMKI